MDELQQLARSLLIFGIHVHVAMPDRDDDHRYDESGALFSAAPSRAFHQLAVLDGARYRIEFLSHHHFPPVSAHGRARNISARGAITKNYIKLLVELHCIDNAKKIWWDVRPHPMFGTLEFRICDVPTRAEDSITLAALTQAMS